MTQFLTIKEAAEDLRVCQQTIRRLVADGRLPSVHMSGKVIRIFRSDWQRFLFERHSEAKVK